MRTAWLWTLLLTICLVFGTTGVAWAHVVVTPEEAQAGAYEKFTVTVPSEKEIPTTEVRVEVPEGFTFAGVKPMSGWEYELEEDGGFVRAITWSGGQIGPQEFQEFEIQAQTPESPGEFSWSASQTYEDGSVVEWAGPPDSEEPASVVEIVSDSSEAGGSEAAEGDEHGDDHGGGETEAPAGGEDLPATGGAVPIAVYGGLGASGLALATVSLALLRRR